MKERGSKEAVSTVHGAQGPAYSPFIVYLEIPYMMNHFTELYPAAPFPQKHTLMGSTRSGLISN